MGVPAVLAGLAVAKGAAGYLGQQKMSKTVQQNAQAGYENQVAQERSAAIDQMNKAAREALQAKGSARVKGAEQGISITSLLQDLSMQRAENQAITQQNYDNRIQAAANGAQSMMNQAPRPSLVGTLINTAADAGTAYFAGKKT